MLSSSAATFSHDSVDASPITIGEAISVTTHDADRRINVIVPVDYAKSDKEYPLFVMIDGGLEQDLFLSLGALGWNQLWGRSQPAILVGIETVDRQRELLPPTRSSEEQKRYPSAGESAVFRRWLAEKVLPMIRERYRDDGRAFLIGESAAGHFVAETWVVQPDLFDGYAAISPSLQWDKGSLVDRLRADPSTMRPPIFISLANEGGATETGVEKFVQYTNSDLCFADRRDDLFHANALYYLLPEALQYIMPTPADWLDEYGLGQNCTLSKSAKPSD